MTVTATDIEARNHVYVPIDPPTSTIETVWMLEELRRISAATLLIQESLLELEARVEALEP